MNSILSSLGSSPYAPLLLIAVLVIWTINNMQRNFLFNFIAVKMSKGKKILVFSHTASDIYTVNAQYEGKALKFTTRDKKPRVVTEFKDSDFSDFLGVKCLQYDESCDKVIRKVKDGVQYEEMAITPQIADALITEAQNLPQNGDQFRKLMIIGLIVVALVAGASAYFGYQNMQGLQYISQQMVELKGMFIV